MAERDPNVAQVDDPVLQADLLRVLRVRGPLGILNVPDLVMPVVLMGSVRPFDFVVLQPAYAPGNVSSDTAVAPAVNTVLADTGALAAGTYDFQAFLNYGALATTQRAVELQHRNAANAASLAVWRQEYGLNPVPRHFSFAVIVAANERLRFETLSAFGAGEAVSSVVMARVRV